jgi:lipopolysaccharide transport system ATP-binding protein
MSTGALALSASSLGKQYRIGAAAERATNLREAVTRALGRPWQRMRRRSGDGRGSTDLVWVLQDVSFEVRHGEVLGIVGRNGAGKSTLLKILSRIVEPTVGSADVHGRVGSLLEVGTGFHPELTGRDNVFLNGAILGMDRRYNAARYDQIVDFAGIGKFIDTPVKRFSSGMYLRLAFAVAAHLEPDVLIVDEVLAVGDAEFQRKCIGRMTEVSCEGRTVLFVSHDLRAVQRLCTRCMLLENGRVALIGDTGEVVLRYLARGGSDAPPAEWVDVSAAPRETPGPARITAVRYAGLDSAVEWRATPGGALTLDVRTDTPVPIRRATLGFSVRDRFGAILFSGSSTASGMPLHLTPGCSTWRFTIAGLPLRPGSYQFDTWLSDPVGTQDRLQPALRVEVVERDVHLHAPRYDPRYDGPLYCEYHLAPLGEIGRPPVDEGSVAAHDSRRREDDQVLISGGPEETAR